MLNLCHSMMQFGLLNAAEIRQVAPKILFDIVDPESDILLPGVWRC